MLDPAAEAHRKADVGARELPRRAVGEPWIGVLDLAAAHDVLREHAVLVADAVAERGQAERGHRVEEAGRQAPEAAVAERRIGLALGHVLEALRMTRHGLGRDAGEVERGERVAHRATDQELHREVVDAPRLRLALLGLGPHPAARELLARRMRHGLHEVGRARIGARHAHGLQEMILDPRVRLARCLCKLRKGCVLGHRGVLCGLRMRMQAGLPASGANAIFAPSARIAAGGRWGVSKSGKNIGTPRHSP